MTASPNRKYLPAIDHLRAFAALLVLFYHGFRLLVPEFCVEVGTCQSDFWVQSFNPLITLVEEGHSGVSLFICLSGFILSLGTFGRSISYPKFLLARFLRIYPLLTVCLLAAVLSRPWGSVSAYTVLISYIPLSVAGNLQSVFTTMFWAVTIEFQCYLLFPFVVRLTNAFGLKALLTLLICAVLIRFGVYWLQGGGSQRDLSYASIFGRFDQFLIGMIAAHLYLSGKLRFLGVWHLAASSILVLISITVFNQAGGYPADGYWKLAWPTYEAVMWTILIASYLHAPLLSASALSKLFAKLGEISYSSYLWHFAIIAAVIKYRIYLQPTGLPQVDSLITTALVVLPLVAIIAIVSCTVIELPFLRLRPRYTSSTTTFNDASRSSGTRVILANE